MKHKNQSRVLTARARYKENDKLPFREVTTQDIEK